MNDSVFIGTIVFLIFICVYIYLTKNKEIDKLTQQNTQDTNVGRMVDITNYNSCMSELNNLRDDLRETQEQNSRQSMSILDALVRNAVESQEDLNNLSS